VSGVFLHSYRRTVADSPLVPRDEEDLAALLETFMLEKAVYELVLWAIDGWTGRATSSLARWLPAATGGIMWPMVVGVLGRVHTPR
jgi:hypothetical protein